MKTHKRRNITNNYVIKTAIVFENRDKFTFENLVKYKE